METHLWSPAAHTAGDILLSEVSDCFTQDDANDLCTEKPQQADVLLFGTVLLCFLQGVIF